MGGQLIKGYSIQGDSMCTTGVALSWKMYKAQKSSSHSSASIFLIEKKQIKKQKDDVLQLSRKQATNLLRIRHPGILAVLESSIEDENVLAFVSEKVEGNLSLLLKQDKLSQFIQSELELKLFLYPFLDTLEFIHSTLKQVHLALNLQNIYVTAEGKWKMSGFGHNQVLSSEQPLQCSQKIINFSCSAPELVNSRNATRKSDIFSVGLIILKVLEYINKSYKHSEPIRSQDDYGKQMERLKNLEEHPIFLKQKQNQKLKSFLKGMLSMNPQNRFSLDEALRSDWLNDSALLTVKYLDKLTNYENKQQLEFLKGLAGVLDDFPERILLRIIIPKLLDLLKFNSLIASIVFIIIDLLKRGKLQKDIFQRQVWSSLKTVTQAKETTAHAIYLFVAHLDIFETFVGEPDFSTHLLPLYLKCFDCPAKLKHLALSLVMKISKKVDYQFVKTKLLTKLLVLFKDPSLEIRKDALRALLAMIRIIDTQTVTLTILPALETVRKAGADPFVNAVIAKIYSMLGESLPIQTLSGKVLPALIPYLTDPLATKKQFSQWKVLIFKMIERIEKQSKQIQNQGAPQNFTDADFKLKEVQIKTLEQKPGNYSFLTNYTQPKEQTITPPQETAIFPSSQETNFSFSQHSQSKPQNSQFEFNFEKPQQKYEMPPLEIRPLENIETKPEEKSFKKGEISNINNLMTSGNFSFPEENPSQVHPSKLAHFQPTPFQFLPASVEPNFSLEKKGQYDPLSIKTDKTDNFFPQQTKVEFAQNNFEIHSQQRENDIFSTESGVRHNNSALKKDIPLKGAASGPAPIKKLVGPSNTLSKDKKPPLLSEKPEMGASKKYPSNELSSNFNGLGDFGNISTEKNVMVGSSKPNVFGGEDNPFAEIETGKPPVQTPDIYSYFDTEEAKTENPKKADGKQSFDLI